jgi:hypothetical protein
MVTATNSIGTKVMTTTVVTINNPVPTISNMLPLAPAHGVTTSVTLTGTNFIAGAKVKLQPHGGGATVTYTPGSVTSTQITVNVSGVDIPSAGSYDIWVENPTPPPVPLVPLVPPASGGEMSSSPPQAEYVTEPNPIRQIQARALRMR